MYDPGCSVVLTGKANEETETGLFSKQVESAGVGNNCSQLECIICLYQEDFTGAEGHKSISEQQRPVSTY